MEDKSIHKAFKFHLYPTIEQAILLNKHFGCARFIFNYFLNFKKTEYETAKKKYSRFDIQKKLTSIKTKKKYNWLNEVNSQSLQCVIQHLDTVYLRFFKHTSKFPKFKCKKNGGSFKIPFQITNGKNANIRINENSVYLPKFKSGIKFDNHQSITGKIISATISKTPTNKYFISFCTKTNVTQLPKRKETIGIDLGLKSFAVTSTAEVINNPRFLRKKLEYLKYLCRQHSKKQLKSSNREKSRLKLCNQYEKITNQRTNFLHQLSTRLIHENQVICLEDLNITGMSTRCKPIQDENGRYLPNGQSKKSGLNQAIHDVSWSEFIRQLEYKADWYGRQIVFINRFYPSSKCCSNCGWINQSLDLSVREWTCPNCNVIHDRDYNAAINIHEIGINWFNNLKDKNKTGSGTESVFKQKPQEASSLDESVNVEALAFMLG
jgi:putative transposase